MVNFNNKLPQHIQHINILMVTRQWEGRAMHEERGGRLRCTSTLYEAQREGTKEESERVFVCMGEKKREKQ